MDYLVVLEKAERNWAAYSPDVPGCIATGRTKEITLRRFEGALQTHLELLKEQGLPIPEPKASAAMVHI